MTNRPGRPRPQQRMTPDQLRDLIARAGITQARAAELAGVQLRTMQHYLMGDRPIPLSVSGLLCLSCIWLGAPAGMLEPWLPPGVVVTPHRGQEALSVRSSSSRRSSSPARS